MGTIQKQSGAKPGNKSKHHLTQLLEFDKNLFSMFSCLPAPCAFSWPLRNRSLIAGLEKRADVALIGIDEVGRGCLAGPVVACAVCLPAIDHQSSLWNSLAKLNDSKLLSPTEREELAAIIRANAAFAIGEASVEEIDSINILQASLLAMRRARQTLAVLAPAVVLIDGNKRVDKLVDRQVTVIKGDLKSASIAAASVVAKVYRDKLMTELSNDYPDYLWHKNKGYASAEHIVAIQRSGLSKWHRRSFSYKV